MSLSSSYFFPSSAIRVLTFVQIPEAAQDVGVHEEEVIRHEEVFVLDVSSRQVVAPACGQVEQGLQEPKDGVEQGMLGREEQDGVQGQQGEEQHGRERPAQDTVRDVLEGEHSVSEGIEQRREAGDGLQASGRNAHLAFAFLPDVGRTAFRGVSVPPVGDGVAPHDDAQGEHEVVQQGVRLHLLVQLGADGEQFARGAHGRVKARVEVFQGGLVTPVQAFSASGGIGFVAGMDALLSRHASHPRVGAEGLHDVAQGVPVEEGVGVRKDHVGRPHFAHAPVQGGGLAQSQGLEEHFCPGPLGEAFVRGVRASVRHPQDVQLLPRVVQGQAVRHLLVHHVLLVVGRYEEGQFRQSFIRRRGGRGVLPSEAFLELHQHPEQETVAHVGVEDDAEAYPKNDFQILHNLTLCLMAHR